MIIFLEKSSKILGIRISRSFKNSILRVPGFKNLKDSREFPFGKSRHAALSIILLLNRVNVCRPLIH